MAKWTLLILVVPIAVAVNAFRVTVTGILSEVNPELAKGALHLAEGWLMFALALACLVSVHWLLSWFARRRQRPASELKPISEKGAGDEAGL